MPFDASSAQLVSSPQSNQPSQNNSSSGFDPSSAQLVASPDTSQQDQSEGFSDVDNAQPQPHSTGNIPTDIAGDVARGFLNGSAQTVDIVNGVSKMLKNATQLNVGSEGLTNVSNKLKQLASQQPESSNPIVSGIGQFAGGIAPAVAQFAGTGGGIGFVARSAALAAADDYNKNQSVAGALKSGAIGGAVGKALDMAPEVLMKASELAKKWGKTSGKQYLQSVMGASDADTEEIMSKLNDMDLNPKSKNIENEEEVKKTTQAQLDELSKSNEDLVNQQVAKNREEYSTAEAASKQAVINATEDNTEKLQDFQAQQRQDERKLASATSANMMGLIDSGTQKLASEVALKTQNVVKAKNALDNTVTSALSTASNSAQALEKAATDDVAGQHAALESNGNDFVPTPIIAKEMDAAIGAENSKYFKKIGVRSNSSIDTLGADKLLDKQVYPGVKLRDLPKEAQDQYIEQARRQGQSNVSQIAKSGNTTESLVAAPQIKNSGIMNFIKMTNEERHGLVDEATNGKTSLAAMDASSASFEAAAKKGFFGTTLPEQVAVVASNIKRALNPTRLYQKYPEQLAHLKPLAEANMKYSSKIDALRNALSLYKDNGRVDGTFNPEQVFKALDKNDTDYIAKLKQADEALPPQDRIFDKVKSAYDDYKKVESNEEASLAKTEKSISDRRRLVSKKFDEMKDNLDVQQTKELNIKRREARLSNKAFSQQEGQKLKDLQLKHKQDLDTIKAQKDKELETLQNSVNKRRHELRLLHMARNERAAYSSNAHIWNNVSNYQTIDGMSSFNIPKVLRGNAMRYFTAPSGVSRTVRTAVNAPDIMKGLLDKASKTPGSSALKKLVAVKASGR